MVKTNMGKRRGKKKEASDTPVIVWFRQDLRVNDNPALHMAAQTGQPVLCVFVSECPSETKGWGITGCAKLWLHHALVSLNRTLQMDHSSRLLVLDGPAAGSTLEALSQFIQRTGAQDVYYNRVYEPWLAQRDRDLTAALHQVTHQFIGTLLSAEAVHRSPSSRSTHTCCSSLTRRDARPERSVCLWDLVLSVFS